MKQIPSAFVSGVTFYSLSKNYLKNKCKLYLPPHEASDKSRNGDSTTSTPEVHSGITADGDFILCRWDGLQ
jgi:hypothetical protein